MKVVKTVNNELQSEATENMVFTIGYACIFICESECPIAEQAGAEVTVLGSPVLSIHYMS